MKKHLILVFVLISSFAFSQAFSGKNDKKLGIGAAIVDGGSGINATFDYGLGENISVGASSTYLLSADEERGADDPDINERFDIKGRFNVHLNNLLKFNPNLDVYPGINLGIHNLGLHLGGRYFFNKGLGVYTEFDFPIAKFNDNTVYQYFNSFKVHLGVSLNL